MAVSISINSVEDIWNMFPNKSSICFNKKMAITRQVEILLNDCTKEEIASLTLNLSQAFLNIELKSPLKRTLATLLTTLNLTLNNEIENIFTSQLQSSLEQNYSLNELQLKTDNLLSCLDNFKVGQNAVKSNFTPTFSFIFKNLSELKNQLNPIPNPQETTIIFNVSQALLKALSLTLQEYESCTCEEKMSQDILVQLFPIVTWFLQSDCVVLNCKLSSGITYVNLIRNIATDKITSLIDSECFKCQLPQNLELGLLFGSRNVSQVSQLCLWNGLLVSLSNEELLTVTSDCEFVGLKIHNKLNSIGDLSNEESAVLISFSRTLLTWTERIYDILKLPIVPDGLKSYFDGAKSPLMKQLLNYVFANWDHTVDCLRHHSKDIFKYVVGFHSVCFGDDDKFLLDLSDQLLNLPYHCKAKYKALCHLVEVLGAGPILALKPNILDEIDIALSELSLAPHYSEFFTVISKAHHSEVDVEIWEKVWLDVIIKCMCYGTKVQKSSTQQYILPKMLQIEPKGLQYFITELVSDKYENKERSLCALIACIKTAKCSKINFNSFGIDDKNQNSELWKNCLPYSSIKLALRHTDDQVRLDGLSILCYSPKTTEPFEKRELELLQFFLKFNLNVQSPAFRQKMVSLFKKMFIRIKLNSIMEIRKMDKNDSQAILGNNILVEYINFLKLVNETLIENLCPESNFARRCTALQLLVLLNETFPEEVSVSGGLKELPFSISLDKHFSRTLWDLLRDTYENNKESVLELMNSVPLEKLGLENEEIFREILEMALNLASSSRPPDSVTAAYILRVLSKSNLCISLASSICSVSAKNLENVPHSRIFSLLQILSMRLEEELAVACLSLLKAASNGPLYGVMTCIRALMEDIDLLNSCNHPAWNELVQKIIGNYLEAGLVVQPVVCNASPEGHLPMDTDPNSIGCLQSAIQRAIGRRFTTAVVTTDKSINETSSDGLTVDLVKTKAVTAQMLLLCSWRAHKEVSLLLGLVAEKCSVASEGLIQPEKFLKIGKYFTKQLAEIKHRGAFEQAYVGFTKLCYRLWRCEDPELHNLPEQWLNDLIEMISENRNKNDTSTGPTRRSAGVPFIVQALLVSEPTSTNRRCFKKALPAILNLTEIRFDNEEPIENSRIHAMNVLRALYRDAQLGEDIMPFVSDGIKSAILGFKSENWGIRNAATLLFTTLVTRVFGVNRSRNEPHKKNCLTGRVFFQRFPQLFDFLLSELKIATENLSMLDSSALHPILLLLSRLYPSPVEGSGSYVKLAFFIPFVEICATKSPVWWTRVLASQALVPLLPVEDYPQYLEKCFEALTSIKTPQNEIHGKLLQVLAILKDIEILPEALLKKIECRVSDWLKNSSWLMSEINECEATKCAYLEAIHLLACHFSLPMEIADFLVNHVFLNTTLGTGGAWLLRSTLSILIRKVDNLDTEQIQKLIVFSVLIDNYEMQVVALDFLTWLFDCDKEIRESRSLDFVPFSKDFNWISTTEDKHSIKIEMEKSLELRQTLLQLAAVEEIRPWCLSDVYLVLSKIPVPFNSELTLDLRIEELNLILEKIKACTFDDVAVSMILYSSCLLLEIYNSFHRNQVEPSKDVCRVVERWSTFILNNSSPDNSSLRRLAVTQALMTVTTIMVDTSLGAYPLTLWDSTVKLLQDDEPEIRNGIVNLTVELGNILKKVYKFDHLEDPYPSVQSYAMGSLINYFTVLYCKDPYCLSLLIAWSLRCELDLNNPDEQNDEQPFDKGEMNVFLEEISLTRLCCEKIEGLLETSEDISLYPLFKLPWIPLAFNLNGKDSNVIEELIENCLEECHNLVQDLSNCDLSHIYLCHLVDGLSLKLYQRVLLIKVIAGRVSDFSSFIPTIMVLKQKLNEWKYPNSFIFSIVDLLNHVVK